jgi:hypothetical protein
LSRDIAGASVTVSLEIAALGLSVLAIVLFVAVEWIKRPKLTVAQSPFSPSGPTDWTFASVQIRNKPLRRPWRWFLSRESAQGCKVSIDFLRWADETRVMQTVPGRWSSHPEPFRTVRIDRPTIPEALADTLPYRLEYDPTIDAREQTVAASRDGEEVAVAILISGKGAGRGDLSPTRTPSKSRTGSLSRAPIESSSE